MKFQKTKIALALLSSSLIALPSFAEEVIDEIVVEGQYLASDRANSVKTPTPIIDVPQSLSIFSADDIKERGITDIRGVVDYTPGVNSSQGEGHRDAVVFRGNRSTADFYLDGNRDDVQYFRSLYNLEQVEVLRGPNALLFGRGGTGGIINRVTKKAEIGESFTGYSTSIDSFGGFGFAVDSNFSTSDTSSVRINAHYEELENHRDFFGGERFGFNPTAKIQLSERTTLDLSYEYANHERFIDRGIPSLGTRPATDLVDITFTDPEQSETTLDAHLFRAAIEHRFSDTVKGNFSAFYGDYDKVYQNFFPVGFDGTANTVDIDGYIDTTERQSLILSSNLVAEFNTGNIGHTLVFGGEYIDTSSDQDRLNSVFDLNNDGIFDADNSIDDDVATFSASDPISFSNGIATVLIADPITGIVSPQTIANSFADLNDDTQVDIEVTSIFIQDQIAFSDQLDVVIGLRYDQFDIREFDIGNGGEISTSDDSQVSPRLGIIYKPQENISLYASYSETFLPRSGEQFANIGATNNGDPFDADEFENLEIGAKWDINPNLSLTAALFENQQSQLDTDDLDLSGATLVTVDTEVSGFEFQVNGRINDVWSLSANYSYLDGEFGSQNAAVDGRDPREIPENTISVWNSFDISPKFGLGLGAIYQDESFTSNPNANTLDSERVTLPSYVRVDASGFYDVSDKLRIQFNVENLLDKEYFPNAHTDNNITVGAPINATLSLSGKF